MTWLLAWLTGSKLGRYAAVALTAVAAISLALLKAFLAGRAKEKAKQTQASLENLRSRMKTDDEIRTMPRADRAKQLDRWMRD